MKVLVTGANGMLGQDLCPILERENFEVISTDRQKLDITDLENVKSFINDCMPDFIIHAAAYTNVDKAESDSDEALKVNHEGTHNLALVSGKLNIPILYISTDYVFDGTKMSKYEPHDATNPLNMYGLSKLMGEQSIQSLNEKHYIVRTSWLYGHKGKNFVETMIELAKKNKELKVVEDQIGCPTWTVALIQGILQLIKNNSEYGTYHICGSGSTSWHGFAEEIFKLMNYENVVLPVSTEEFPRPAKRPMYSVMNNNGMCADWKDSLKEYISLRSN